MAGVPDGQGLGCAAILRRALNIYKPKARHCLVTTVLLWPILPQSFSQMPIFDLVVHSMHSGSKVQTGFTTKVFAWPLISKGSQGHLFMCRALAVLLCGI